MLQNFLLSIVIPTFNERENVQLIAKKIHEALRDLPYEIVFVDDSRDDTPQVLEKLSFDDSHVRYFHRTNERGLGTAIARGFELAKGDIISVMDSDLQHPPEIMPAMLSEIENGADIVSPSRFIPGGKADGLHTVYRKFVSWVARWMARLALRRLLHVTDCGGGLFMFRKQVIDSVKLNPVGWKMQMEVLVRGKYKEVVQIPYHFQRRQAGESKLSGRAIWNYIRHILVLIKDSPEDMYFYKKFGYGFCDLVITLTVFEVFKAFHTSNNISVFAAGISAMLWYFYALKQLSTVNGNQDRVVYLTKTEEAIIP